MDSQDRAMLVSAAKQYLLYRTTCQSLGGKLLSMDEAITELIRESFDPTGDYVTIVL